MKSRCRLASAYLESVFTNVVRLHVNGVDNGFSKRLESKSLSLQAQSPYNERDEAIN